MERSINPSVEVKEFESPRTQAVNLLASGDVDKVRKELVFGKAFLADIKIQVNAHKRKQATYKALTTKYMKKYHLITETKEKVGISRFLLNKKNEARKKKVGLGETNKLAHEFFLRDEVTTPTASKNDTKTNKGTKMHKRYLNDTMLNLHERFLSEYPSNRLSYASFTRNRPFYCVEKRVEDRETVQCKTHANAELLSSKLHQLGILHSKNTNILITSIVCSTDNIDCMYGRCETCKGKIKDIYKFGTRTMEEMVEYYSWVHVVEKRNNNKGEEFEVRVINKERNSKCLSEVCKLWEDNMKGLMPHQFRIVHQYKILRKMKEAMKEDECTIQVDYSENYACKAATETQGMHFGASRKQISLHTCHATFGTPEGDRQTRCYCSVSEDTRHGPEAIWAHLDPVLRDFRSRGVKILHVISDGPTTQYRNKLNFAGICKIPFNLGFEMVVWNFLEKSHGKGPADGIGAVIKQKADRLVAHGKDILDIDQFKQQIMTQNLNITLFYTETSDIDEVASQLEANESLKGTMKLHQILTKTPGQILYRDL